MFHAVKITYTVMGRKSIIYLTHLLQSEFVPLNIMVRSLNSKATGLTFLLLWAYRLKQLKVKGRYELLPEGRVGRVPGCVEVTLYGVRIFGGCAGGTPFRYARSLHRLRRVLLLTAQLKNALTVICRHLLHIVCRPSYFWMKCLGKAVLVILFTFVWCFIILPDTISVIESQVSYILSCLLHKPLQKNGHGEP
jgi:hypothetical protein